MAFSYFLIRPRILGPNLNRRWTAILRVGIQMYVGTLIVCELMVTSYKHMCGVRCKT